MALAALIFAYHESDEPGGLLRATLPIAGRSLVERQARLAAAAGAERIVILVERIPPELTSAIDSLRSDGLDAVLARSPDEAAEAVGPSDQLLLIADGLLVGHEQIARLASAGGPALLTVPDGGADDRFERIDAQSRWAGLALLDGASLRKTAAMLGDWDLQSTLLRRAVQGGARQFALRTDAGEEPPIVAERGADLEEAEDRIVERAGGEGRSWASRLILAPIERLLTSVLMPTAVGPVWLNLGAAFCLGLAAILFAKGWLWAGTLFMLLALPLDGTADRLGALRLHVPRGRDWWGLALPLLSGAALLGVAWWLSFTRGWGCLVLAAAIIAFMAALRTETTSRVIPGTMSLAERKGMTLLMLPFALANAWVTGLIVLALYAAGSMFWAQRQVHGRRDELAAP